MANSKRKWDLLSEEKRRATVNEIIDFFLTDREQEIGIIAAEDLLDFFLESVGTELYNKGVEDAVDFLGERFESLQLDLEALKK